MSDVLLLIKCFMLCCGEGLVPSNIYLGCGLHMSGSK